MNSPTPFPLPRTAQPSRPDPPQFLISIAYDGTPHLCRARTADGRRQVKRINAVEHLPPALADRLHVWLAIALAGRRRPGVYAPAEPIPPWLQPYLNRAH